MHFLVLGMFVCCQEAGFFLPVKDVLKNTKNHPKGAGGCQEKAEIFQNSGQYFRSYRSTGYTQNKFMNVFIKLNQLDNKTVHLSLLCFHSVCSTEEN